MEAIEEASKGMLLFYISKLTDEQAEKLISRLPEWISLLEVREPLYPLEQVERTG